MDYEKTDVKGGGMLHPGFRWKDHETHNPEKSKQFRKRKDGYRYTQSYDGSPRWIHNQLTSESSYDSNGNFDEVGYENDINEARRPSDKTVGKHTLKGLRYDKNGNPLYTSDTMSDDENYETKRLLTNLYGWTQFFEEEFDKANIKDNGSRYSMRGALREMQNIIGQLSDLCLKSNPNDRTL